MDISKQNITLVNMKDLAKELEEMLDELPDHEFAVALNTIAAVLIRAASNRISAARRGVPCPLGNAACPMKN